MLFEVLGTAGNLILVRLADRKPPYNQDPEWSHKSDYLKEPHD
jgi:hypothetical protein